MSYLDEIGLRLFILNIDSFIKSYGSIGLSVSILRKQKYLGLSDPVEGELICTGVSVTLIDTGLLIGDLKMV